MMTEPACNVAREPYYGLVRSRPGISQRDVARAMGVDDTTAEYHLRRLERGGFIVRERAGKVVAHYAQGAFSERERRLMRISRLGHRVLGLLASSERELRACHIAERLGLSVSPVRYALDQLVLAGFARKAPGGWYAAVGVI